MLNLFVGVAGFEPATSASQTRRDNRATLHSENQNKSFYFGLQIYTFILSLKQYFYLY